MATNWTDATLFVKNDVVLPKLLNDLDVDDLDVDIYFEPNVKIEIGKQIRYRYHDWDDFDIEQITSDSITELKNTALYLNLYYICRDEVVTGLDSDTYAELASHYWVRYQYYLKMDIELVEFNEPDGINDSKAFSVPIMR